MSEQGRSGERRQDEVAHERNRVRREQHEVEKEERRRIAGDNQPSSSPEDELDEGEGQGSND